MSQIRSPAELLVSARQDLFIYRVDKSGRRRERKETGLGGEVYIDAAAAAGERVVLAGSVGSEA
jgi:hypothetical protein